MLLPISSIIVMEDRQRQAFPPEEGAKLMDSIREVGLINPPVVREEGGRYILIAGERRLRALALLLKDGQGFKHGSTYHLGPEIPVTLWTELSPADAEAIELEENITRLDLTWQERTKAIARLHALRCAANPEHTVADTAAILSAATTEDGKNKAERRVFAATNLVKFLDNPEVASAKSAKDAVKVVEKLLAKSRDAMLAETAPTNSRLHHASCLDVLPDLAPRSVDCLLTDPPYGIDIRQMSYQRSSEHAYDDSYESWVHLMKRLWPELERVLKLDAHGYMFCDITRLPELWKFAEEYGFEPYYRPLIWSRGAAGRAPTPEKWPKRVYECIFFFRRGNRPLNCVRPDVLTYSTDNDADNYHGARKPVDLLADLLERSTNPGDLVLDVCAGSGTTGLAAKKLSREYILIEQELDAFNLMTRLLGDAK